MSLLSEYSSLVVSTPNLVTNKLSAGEVYKQLILGYTPGGSLSTNIVPGPYLNDVAAGVAGVKLGQLYYNVLNVGPNAPPNEQNILCIRLT